MAARLLVLALALIIVGCKGEPPPPAKVPNTSSSGKRGMFDFSDRPAPPGVKTGTPGG